MKVSQIYDLMNKVTSEVLGKNDLIAEDLSNVVDVGTELFNVSSADNFVRSLVDHIGKVIFVNRPYSASLPSVLRDGWEFGAACEKITMDLPDAEENETWKLQENASYDPNIFYKSTVSVKFYQNRITFEIPISIADRQVKSAFSNPTQLNQFISMIYSMVDRSLSIKIDSLILRTINNFIGETIYNEYKGADLSTKSGVRAVNLLYLYNQHFNQTLTADKAMTDKDFIRYASMTMSNYIDRLQNISTLFNMGGKDRFTSKDLLHCVMLSDFESAADMYLQSSTFHDKLTALPMHEKVSYWQGSGTDYRFNSISKIHVNTSENHEVTASGVLCVMFDHDALGVSNTDRRTTSNWNPKGEFYNNWYKYDAGYWNDFNENFIVFFIA